MENVLKIENLSYRKNLTKILEDVNLTLKPGKIVALLGENGAGKTTLMRIISGMAKHYRGKVTIAGENSNTVKKARFSFTDGLTGFNNSTKIIEVVHFYETIYDDFDANEFDQLKQFMKIDEGMKLSQLSRGMKEKLIVALTFARKVDLYLLDEPFAGIDAMARKRIIKSIILWKDDDATILISDHFVNEIEQLLDEVVVVKNKTIFAHKTADEIRENNESIESYYEGLYEEEDE